MANRRVGGIVFFKIDGTQFSAKGNWSYNIGVPKKEMIAGADSVHGFKEVPQVPFIEGTVTDNSDLDLEALQKSRDVTCTLELANGKVISIEEAVFASDGNGSSEEGEIEVRMEGVRGSELK